MTADPIQMERKVQQLGSSTLGVTIPADWARKHRIEKGDNIDLQGNQRSGSLLLIPDQSSTRTKESTINADKLRGRPLERALVSQYILGEQSIRIEGTSPLSLEHRDGVLAADRRLIGLSAVEERDHYIIVRCSVAPDNFDIPELLHRLCRTETSMLQGALTALTENDLQAARRSSSRRQQVEKQHNLFHRLSFTTYRNPRLHGVLGLAPDYSIIAFQAVVQDLFSMADIAHEIAMMVQEDPEMALAAESVDRITTLGDALDEATTATIDIVTSPEYDSLERARKSFSRIEDRADKLGSQVSRDHSKQELRILYKTSVLLERCAMHVENMLSVAMHLAIQDDLGAVSN